MIEPEELDGLLEDARMAASTDWEEQFVQDLIERRSKFGARIRLTDRQEAKLRQIAGGEESYLDDGPNARRPYP